MGRLVRDWLLDLAATRLDDEAVVDPRHRWTVADLAVATSRIASALHGAGVRGGVPVAALVGDGAPMVALIHAARRLGAVLVPLNRRGAAAELALQVAASGARLLVHDRNHGRLAASARPDADAPALADVDRMLGGPGSAHPPIFRDEVDLDAPATILFTSGTSGRPKGAILTHGAHLASADAWAALLRPRAGDRWLACLPLFHVAGLAIVVRASRWGVPLEVHPRFDPAAVLQALDEGASLVSLVGPMLERVLDAAGDRPAPPTLRAVLVGGGPIVPALVLRARRLGYPVLPTYGLTETASGVAALPADAHGDRCATVGRPLSGVELRIEVDGRSVGRGEVGEICVRGPMVFAGYVGLPDDSARVLRAGWLHTGDVGMLEASGDLTVFERRDDLIVSGGENVYPAEVEAALLAHPCVAEAIVVGRPDPRWGSVPVAAVVLRPDRSVSDAALTAHCRDRLAGFKVPVAFHRLARLPGGPSPKLRRSVVRDLLRAGAP